MIGFDRGVLGLAKNPARGTGFFRQNTEGVAQHQHPMIKTYNTGSTLVHVMTGLLPVLLPVLYWCTNPLPEPVLNYGPRRQLTWGWPP